MDGSTAAATTRRPGVYVCYSIAQGEKLVFGVGEREGGGGGGSQIESSHHHRHRQCACVAGCMGVRRERA